MKPRVAACLIVKGSPDEAPLLDACLASLKPHVDGVFLNLNAQEGEKVSPEVRQVAEKYTDNIIETAWTGNFVQARTDNFAQVTKEYDWIFWTDADDTVESPEKIREVAAVASDKISGVHVMYDYTHDEYGNVTVKHYTCRLVRNNGAFAWKSSFSGGDVSVHETLQPVRAAEEVRNDEFKIIHHTSPGRQDASLRRNIALLEGMLTNSKETPDPRVLFYLATHYMDAKFYDRAKMLFEQYLKLSGWPEERSQAWVYLGDIYRRTGDANVVRGCYMRALAENPKDPSPYVELGELEKQEGLWEKAVEWLETAVAKKPPATSIILRPLDATYRAYKLLAEAYTNLGADKLTEAEKWLTKAIELRPFDPDLHEARKLLDMLQKNYDLNKAALTLINELREEDRGDKALALVDNLPEAIITSPLVSAVRNHYRPAETWGDNSIAIVCGTSALGHWGPWSLETGLGGSEEAVVQMSRELTKLGYEVTVYATPGTKAGDYGGVHWKHYWEFNSKDAFNILISWRTPALFDKPFNAKQTYVWLHDVIEKGEFFPERLANITGVFFLGEYHRNIYPMVPDDKAIISGNGIDPRQFVKHDDKHKRNQYRCIYMSAHERGLEILYQIWPDVKKAVPKATLDVYYGWGSYDAINKDNPERMAWKERILQYERDLANLGVTNHGRVGHDKISREIFKSGVYAYPCAFPEVYCISCVKAQAGGAYPVVSDYAAVGENVAYGDKVHIERFDERTLTPQWGEEEVEAYKIALIEALTDRQKQTRQRKAMMQWTRNNKSWEATAKGWDERFNSP